MFVATARRISLHRVSIARLYPTALSTRHTASSTHTGAPSPLLITVKKFAGEVKPNSFIVTLKPGPDMAAHLAALQPHLTDSKITYDYSGFLNAYCGTFSENTLSVLRASPDVKRIQEVCAPNFFGNDLDRLLIHRRGPPPLSGRHLPYHGYNDPNQRLLTPV